jgi:hypothetical protein
MIVSMRVAVFLLVLVNLLFFVWARGYLGAPASPDARRLDQQLLADQLTGACARRAAAPSEQGSRSSALRARMLQAVSCGANWQAADADQIERLVGRTICRLQGDASHGGGEQWLLGVHPATGQQGRSEQENGRIAAAGHFQDYFVVQASGPNQLAISLGTYRSEEAANAGSGNPAGERCQICQNGRAQGPTTVPHP